MSIFSKIRGAKKAAEKHKEASKVSTASQEKAPKPYKHVPTHAAVDALSGAPSSWREEDRTAIQAANKHRQSLSRNNSDLSSISYGRQPVRINSSFIGSERSSRGRLRPVVDGELTHPGDQGYDGFESPPRHMASRKTAKSPLSSTPIIRSEAPSPSSASSSSTSSDDILELPATNRKSVAPMNIFEHVHKSTTRKVGEAPIMPAPPVPAVTCTNPPMPRASAGRSWRFSRAGDLGGSPAITAH